VLPVERKKEREEREVKNGKEIGKEGEKPR
jgi:hypothetical protein